MQSSNHHNPVDALPDTNGSSPDHILLQKHDALQERIDMLEQRLSRTELSLQKARTTAACYRAIVEDQPELVARFRPDGTLLFVNQAFAQAFATTPATLIQTNLYDLIPSAKQTVVREQLATLGPQQPVTSFDYCTNYPDGTMVWRQWSTRVILNEQGKATVYQIVGRDITERLQTEDVHRTLVHNAVQGLAIFRNGRMLFANPAASATTGYPIDELLAMTPEETAAIVHPDDRGKVLTHSQHLEQGQESQSRYSVRIHRKDGELRWIEVFSTAIEYKGQPAVQMAYIDVTERIEMEEALRESEERFRALTIASPDAIIMIDNTGDVCFWNQAAERIFGYSSQEAIGREIHQLIVPETYHSAAQQGLEKFRTTGEGLAIGQTAELVATHKEGFPQPVEISLSAVKIHDEWYALGIARDISERKLAEAALHDVNRTLTALNRCNEVLIRATNEQDLLQDICQIAVNEGGYRFAWVGFAQHDSTHSVRPVASAGMDQGYLDTITVRWDDTPQGRGPTGIAIRLQRPHVVSYTQHDPDFAPWRDETQQRGFASSAALPLVIDEHSVGALSVYAEEPDSFDEQEVALLVRLTDNLAYGIRILRSREAHRQAQADLQASEQRFRTLVENIHDVIFSLDPQGRFTYISPVITQLTGYEVYEVIGRPFEAFIHPDDSEAFHVSFQQTLSGKLHPAEFRVVARSGETVYVRTLSRLLWQEENVIGITGVMTDITERKQSEVAIQQANEQLTYSVRQLEQRNRDLSFLNGLGEFLQSCENVTDLHEVFSMMAPRLFTEHTVKLALTDIADPHNETISLGEFASENKRDTNEGIFVPLRNQHEQFGELQLYARRGQSRSEHRRWSQLAIIVADSLSLSLTNLQLRARLEAQAIRDPLTGLFNRRYLDEILELEIYEATRYKRTVGVIMLDIDHFKSFNDTHGHDGGDALLRAFGTFLRSHIRGNDLVCRYGGEEFTLILPGATLTDTQRRAEEIRRSSQELTIEHEGYRLRNITISLGVACYPDHGISASELVRIADQALYHAKKAGRNQVQLAQPDAVPTNHM